MKVLLDTHALIWWWRAADELSNRARSVMADPNNTISVSAATAWELAIKVKLGKLDALGLVLEFDRHVAEEGFTPQPITLEQAVRAGLLPLHHRDPLDRLLVAQAQSLNVPILSSDTILDQYDVKRFW